MLSLRKPKRIVIRGHDEKEYPFLVKGGEDLRQDQRIEQIFEVMNAILSQDAACSQRNMQLRTYRVVPMTSRYDLSEPIYTGERAYLLPWLSSKVGLWALEASHGQNSSRIT
jgi:hypothetical protein